MDIFAQLREVLEYSFMQRALVCGSFIALTCAFLGIFLVLRNFSLIGDGLAHISFAAIALALALKAQPLLVSIPVVIAASFLILKLEEKARIYGDAAIGLVSAFGVAAGVFLASVAGGFNVDLLSYLFGNILAITRQEVILTIALSAAVLGTLLFFYHDLFSMTLDEEYALASGVKVGRIKKILTVLISLVVVVGIKLVGTMLISSLIILPSVAALQVGRSFRAVLTLGIIFGVSSVISGIFVSFIFNFPAGATIVLMNFLFFIIAFSYGQLRR
jgi:zinc transport system permease protein